MPNNKILTRIAEQNLKNERAKQDIAKQFPEEQQVPIWIYKMTKLDDPTQPFIFNEADNVTNVIGYSLVKESILYIESEFKDLFTSSSSTQIQLVDNRNVYGYLKDDLDFNQDTHFITFEQFYEDDTLKKVFLIDNNNQYDEINIPEIERVQLKNIVEELNYNDGNKIKFIPAQDLTDYELTKISLVMDAPTAALSEISVYEDNTVLQSENETTALPIPINVLSTSGKDVHTYLPWGDSYLMDATATGLTNLGDIQRWIGDGLFNLFLNILYISHMVQISFAQVKEEGHAPGNPSTIIKPSAGWYWKERMADKDTKGLAAEIQSLIDSTRIALESNQYYGDIDSNNPVGNIVDISTPPNKRQWQIFYSVLNLFSKQIFSNYSFQYGGTYNLSAYFPITATVKMGEFARQADGSEMYKFSNVTNYENIPVHVDYSFTESKTSDTLLDASGGNNTIFYYEGNFNKRTAGQVYIIDFQYAERIDLSYSTTDLQNAQNRMITSPGAVAIGKPNDWVFVNNTSWQDNIAGNFQIPKSVFQNMSDPVFYYALTNEEINDYYNESNTFKNYGNAITDDQYFQRGYPKVPLAQEISSILSSNPTADVEYLIAANSLMRDDAGPNNDYKLVMQDPHVVITSSSAQDIEDIITKPNFNVTFKEINDGTIPYSIASDTLVAQTLGKTVGENSDNIVSAPTLWIPSNDYYMFFNRLIPHMVAYSDLENHIKGLLDNQPAVYEFDIKTTDVNTISEINLNTLGNSHYKLLLTYTNTKVNPNVTKTVEISGSKRVEGKYDNTLYLEPSEDFVDTLTIINFGVN